MLRIFTIKNRKLFSTTGNEKWNAGPWEKPNKPRLPTQSDLICCALGPFENFVGQTHGPFILSSVSLYNEMGLAPNAEREACSNPNVGTMGYTWSTTNKIKIDF